LAQFPMGAQGMPRRYYNYFPEFQPYHVVSTIGAWIAGIGFVITMVCLISSLFRGRKAPSNPWGAATLEWRTPSPPPHYNFATTPKVEDPYDFSVLRYDEKTQNWDYVGRPEGAPAPAH